MLRGWRHDRTIDALRALALALALGLAWIWRDRADLAALRLPDTDDLMRLQQIRDWLGGQAFADLTQYRLGAPGGTPMHWSRLADLAPAALIGALTPLAGRHAAEVAAVALWPPALFAAALFLIARIARSAGGVALAGSATLIGAIAFPATTLFAPGRIDHHGLQLVLLLGAVRALLAPASLARGIALGVAAAASLVVGVETVPLFALLGAVAIAHWIGGTPHAADRLMGIGIGAGNALIVGSLVFAPVAWDYPACDGFDHASFHAALLAALAPVGLALCPARSVRNRALLAVAATGVAALVVAVASPACLAPYGAVEPAVARLWLAHVAEAQPLLAADAATIVAQAGLLLAGIVAGGWTAWRRRTAPWATLFALQLGALAITLVQVRGVYAGTLLAAPALAAVVAAAQARGGARVAAAWLGSAGIVYPLAAQALPAHTPSAGAVCRPTAALSAIASGPALRLLAPIDLGPAIIARTPHHAIAAPYHRDDAGIRAALAFFLGSADHAGDVARAARADAVLWCPGMLGTLPVVPGSTAAALAAGRVPAGLAPPRALPGGVRLYRIAR